MRADPFRSLQGPADEDAYNTYVYLLGAPIFTAGDVKTATATPPAANTSGWNVSLTLDQTGADSAYKLTSRYHVDDPIGVFTAAQTSAKPPCGATAVNPCSDFIAYVNRSTVVAVPVTVAPIRTTVLIQGGFTEASAERLAHELAG